VKTVVTEGVPEIWLSSEDTGAYGNLDVQFFLGLLIVDTCGNYMVIYFRLAKFPGRDVGTNLTNLLTAIVAELRVFFAGISELRVDQSTMLRIGMTNPPFILVHLKEIAAVLCHPSVYSFLHVPVQSGSDSVLTV
jgi:threonylcarbamoyladenosine tRNA methylthiotransferase CDKAL1